MESGALNDLTTEEEEPVECYPGETSQKSGTNILLCLVDLSCISQ